ASRSEPPTGCCLYFLYALSVYFEKAFMIITAIYKHSRDLTRYQDISSCGYGN
ncbi:hypothetical protein Nepgr_007736, partial [Nepenthes gracilis]